MSWVIYCHGIIKWEKSIIIYSNKQSPKLSFIYTCVLPLIRYSGFPGDLSKYYLLFWVFQVICQNFIINSTKITCTLWNWNSTTLLSSFVWKNSAFQLKFQKDLAFGWPQIKNLSYGSWCNWTFVRNVHVNVKLLMNHFDGSTK